MNICKIEKNAKTMFFNLFDKIMAKEEKKNELKMSNFIKICTFPLTSINEENSLIGREIIIAPYPQHQRDKRVTQSQRS